MRNNERANSDKLIGSDDAITWLSKLTWEIAQIFEHPKDNVSVRIYRSMNCAITAWHMVDWIYMLSDDSQREELSRITEAHKFKDGKFDLAIQGWCPAIGLCRQIATAAKHLNVLFNREDVRLDGEFDDEKAEHATTLYISDGENKRIDTDVYQEAAAAWTALYVRLGMPQAQEVYKVFGSHMYGTLPKYHAIDITTEVISNDLSDDTAKA